MKKIVVLIGDIVDSRSIPERNNFQKRFEQNLKEISRKAGDSILAPYGISLGDEFEAVFRYPDTLLKGAWQIIEAIYPFKVRFAFGIGKLSTDINREKAFRMDGPAFHIARDGILELKKYSWNIAQIYSNGFESLDLVNQSLLMLFNFSNNWKLSTIKILNGLLEEKTIEQISVEIKKTERAVYKNIKTNHLRDIVNFLEVLVQTLKREY